MHNFNKKIILATLSLAMLITVSLADPALYHSNVSADAISITANTDKQNYYMREMVSLTGTFKQDGSPVANGLVSIEILRSDNGAYMYRTLKVGNPSESWPLTIVETSITDMSGNPLTKVTVKTQILLTIRVKNNLWASISCIVAYTLLDYTLIPLDSIAMLVEIQPQSTRNYTLTVYIPEWATPGKATIFVNAYNKKPKDGGIALIPEETYYFDIVRNSQIQAAGLPAPMASETQTGQYTAYFRMLPDRYARLGTYSVYTVGRTTITSYSSTSTTFSLLSYPNPPQAAFTYYPLQLYANMSATFDASSSSAEGFNDTIIQYEWWFNDPYNPEHIIKQGNFTNPPSPLAMHTFQYGGTYIVALNVTDNEGLWSYTSKPITILPEFGPTADFTWSPPLPNANQSVLFNASSTQLGWSASSQRFSPIAYYLWDFSDGTGIFNVTTPTTYHSFSQPNNYTVQLTVVDADGRSDSVAYIVEVLNATARPWDVDGNGIVNMIDMYIVAIHYGEDPGDPTWDPRADVDRNNLINMLDMYIVAIHYGEIYG